MTAQTHGTVLIADDDVVLLRTYARLLSAAGHTVDTVTSAHSAYEAFRKGEFDAVVSDLQMPGMDGIQLLDAIRKVDHDVPVMFLTGRPQLSTAAKAVELGAFRYLEKPVSLDILTETVDRAVVFGKMARARRKLTESSADAETDRFVQHACFDRAIEKLWMAYQPIVEWSTRSVYAHEALLRTMEPSMPNPAVFLQTAHLLGQELRLGRAIRAAAAGPAAFLDSLLFVNLGAADLEDDQLLDPASPLFAHAKRTVLEITERISLDSISNLSGRLAALRKVGYRIAIDDIGAGYSGLTSLAAIEPEVVKLDMALIRGIDKSPCKQKLVRAMTNLCRDLGSVVVAEGVETRDELAFLLNIGCDLFQGYLFAKPGTPFPKVDWARAGRDEVLS